MSEVKITPFEVSIAPNDVADLRDRLKRTRWTDWLPNSGWGYGTDPDYLKRLCAYWQDDYDFGGYVTRLNAFPQYIARSEEHTSELQSLMRISYAVFCLKKKKTKQ